MTRMTGPECAVMRNLINIHTYIHTRYILHTYIHTYIHTHIHKYIWCRRRCGFGWNNFGTIGVNNIKGNFGNILCSDISSWALGMK